MADFSLFAVVHEYENFVDARVLDFSRLFLGNLLARGGQNFSRLGVDDIVRDLAAGQTVSEVELFVVLVAAHLGDIVAAGIEEQIEQVLTMEEGCEDRYLFVQKSYSGKSLLDVLELNDSMNDIFSNQRLTGILSGIAYNEESMISVSSEGIYQMGVLSGTITGEHVAGFLGARARERNRQEQIRVCKEKMCIAVFYVFPVLHRF